MFTTFKLFKNNCEKKADEKSGLSGIRKYNLCETGSELLPQSRQANLLAAGHFVSLYCTSKRWGYEGEY